MKKYSKIIRHGKNGTHLTIEGNPEVIVMEKLDGANASFGLIEGELKCFSRNKELNENDGLRGFREWVLKNINADELLPNAIYFGEWLVKHTINYPKDAYHQFYLFDIYSTLYDKYNSFDLVEMESERLNLKLAPVFYKGEFQSLDHVNSFVGKSAIGEDGEGIVVKNYSYVDKHGNQIFTKIVSDSFAEKKDVKKQKLPSNANELDNFIDTYLTNARVEKMIYKLVDNGVINEDFGIEDTGTILKNSGSLIVDDILEEEMDSLLKIVKRKISKKYPNKVREVITSIQ
ncbi:RNA ligase family protein [Oceanobacillus sp. FSL H7-0719]|uniref:RNA ligase family protein n=1 Tax=Oceanobacillus sp. FSL H7-0719 TaxID=2954507 RepID=UPI00324B9B0C